MRNPSSFKLSHTIWLGLCIILSFFSTANLLSLTKINHLKKENLNLIHYQLPKIMDSLKLLNTIEQNLLLNQSLLINQLTTPAIKQRSTLILHLVQLTNLIKTAPIPFNLTKLTDHLTKIQAINKKIDEAIQQNQSFSTQTTLMKAFINEVKIARDLLYQFHLYHQQTILERIEYTNAETSMLYLISIIFLILGALISFCFGIIMIRTLNHPIQKTVTIMNALSRGKLDLTIDIEGAYEFEVLKEALEKTVTSLQYLNQIAEKVAKGDYTDKVPIKSKEDKLAKTINLMIENFYQIMRQADAIAKGDYSLRITARSPSDMLAKAINHMTYKLAQNATINNQQNWLKDGLSELTQVISNEKNLLNLSNKAITTICQYLKIPSGTIYLTENNELYIQGNYGIYTNHNLLPVAHKEGILQQVIHSNQPFYGENLTLEHTLPLTAHLGSKHLSLYIYPLSFSEKTLGAIEIISLKPLKAYQHTYLTQLNLILASQIYSKQKNKKLKTVQEKLIQQKTKLEQVNQYKTEFLTTISHELRTPLNSLLYFSHLLKNRFNAQLTGESRELITLIEKSGTNLLLIINDLLDLAKIEAGKLQLTIEAVTLAEALESVIKEFKHLANEKNILLKKALTFSSIIYTDKNRLQQIVRNFLSNALKFTHQGSITIKCDTYANQKQFCISIIDTGIGISKSDQKLLFNDFQQGKKNHQQGTGLGLSIAKKLAILLEGTIELKSTPGIGSTFKLILPFSINPTLPTPCPPPLINKPFTFNLTLKGKKILLIETNMRYAFRLKEHLIQQQNQVTIAYSIQHAKTYLATHLRFDIVLVGHLSNEEDNETNLEYLNQSAKENQYTLQRISD